LAEEKKVVAEDKKVAAEKKAAADAKMYKAEYVGSGTFIISKPKRKKNKVRQTEVKNPRRGSRK
jgi:hypothetical protein